MCYLTHPSTVKNLPQNLPPSLYSSYTHPSLIPNNHFSVPHLKPTLTIIYLLAILFHNSMFAFEHNKYSSQAGWDEMGWDRWARSIEDRVKTVTSPVNMFDRGILLALL